MKRTWKIATFALALTLALSSGLGCGSQHAESSSDGGGGSTTTEAKPSYNETKQMVLDILHTKEGMDTLKDVVRDPQFKNSLAINSADVQTAMQKALTDGSSHMTLMEQMKNPAFATALSQAYKKDNQTILKDLMKDPEYQDMMLSLLKSPDYQKTLYDLMKTPEYRKQTMSIMTQSLQNPQFRVMFLELVKEAIQQGTTENTPNQKQKAGQLQTQSTEGQDKKQSDEKSKEKKSDSGDGEGGSDSGGGGGSGGQ